ncbi:MAG TPA: LamG-like jellyroll fold domain-containing protein [Verrucomicrobiae bacterium]|jgi:hypothetical protein|nr:LamG-like jellyroll fold domain-containing protein [Verrucomicrobiae bacterium]
MNKRFHGFFTLGLGLALLPAASARADYASTVLGDNPLAYYALNPAADGTDVAPDLSGNGNDGVVAGVTAAAGPSAYIPNAGYFNGGAAIDLSQQGNAGLLNFTGPITIEAWVQPSSSSEFADIVAKGYDSSSGQEIVLRVNGPYGANYYASSGSVGVTGGTQATSWTYVVMSSDGTNCSLYENGVLQQRNPDTSGSVTFGDDWAIGDGSSSGNGRLFNGNISEVAIYKHGLSQAQVLNHYYAGLLNSSPATSRPIIATQPQSQTIYTGSAVTFSVTAVSALAMTNQWYKSGSPLLNQTNATLTLLNVGPGDDVNYSVTVGNANGATNSATVSLSLLTPGDTLQWVAAGNNGLWDNSTVNWLDTTTSTASAFADADKAVFDDTTGVPTTVAVDAAVSPSFVTVNSSANNYLFNGSGSLNGPGTLIKKGSSTLTLNTGYNLTGPVFIDGGTVAAGNYAFNSVSFVIVSNGATMDFSGSPLADDKTITVAGAGATGKGAIFNSGGAQYGQVMNVVMTGDTTFGGSSRWDLAGGSLVSGPHNLTIDWSAGAGYGEWNSPTVAANVPGITLQGGNFGMKYLDNTFQNPATMFTVSPNCEVSFWNGGYNGSFHVMSNGRVDLWTAPAAFTGSTVILEDSANWYSWGSSGNDEPVSSAIVLNGVAHFVLGDHNLVYTNLISGAGGFIVDYWNHALVFSSDNTYTGPTIISTPGNSPEVALKGNGAISHSSLIFFGGNDSTVTHIDASGRNDQTLTLTSVQTLGGIGAINGNLTALAGSTIAPGGTNVTLGITAGSNPVGTIAVANNVQLGGSLLMKLASNGSNDVVQAGGNITYGGALNVVNVSGAALTAGTTYQLFNAANYNGQFSSTSLPSLGAGLTWDLSQLNAGKITVNGGVTIGSTTLSGGNVTFSGTGGKPNGTYYVLTATNVPTANWTPIATNSYDGSGNFTVTLPVAPGTPERFYRTSQ